MGPDPKSVLEFMQFFVTGTDTDVGKTIVAAWLMMQLDADYWKPIQCGLEGGTDTERIRALTEYDETRFIPSTTLLSHPLSPHEAARREGVTLNIEDFHLPKTSAPLIIEGAGGLMVPLNDETLMIDLIKKLDVPVILVARSTLGTINHSLLSLEAMRRRGIEPFGVIMNGPPMPHNVQAIEFYGKVRVIAELPYFSPLTREALLSLPLEIALEEMLTPS